MKSQIWRFPVKPVLVVVANRARAKLFVMNSTVGKVRALADIPYPDGRDTTAPSPQMRKELKTDG